MDNDVDIVQVIFVIQANIPRLEHLTAERLLLLVQRFQIHIFGALRKWLQIGFDVVQGFVRDKVVIWETEDFSRGQIQKHIMAWS